LEGWKEFSSDDAKDSRTESARYQPGKSRVGLY